MPVDPDMPLDIEYVYWAADLTGQYMSFGPPRSQTESS
jgi:hypothetical protein